MDFLDIRIIDMVDIVLVAFLLYYLYNLVKGTVAINILVGIIIVYAIYVFTELLEMQLLSKILGGFLGVGMFALVVVFQPEIRKFLLMLGSTNFNARRRFLKQFKFSGGDNTLKMNVDGIIAACKKMSSTNTGALIVLQRNNSLDFVKNTGDEMNLEVNQPIIESIFFKNSPLHDGAMIIEENRITATRVILPVSNDRKIPLRFGLRHRAAVGITEKTDALCLVVSEENGQISYLKDGDFVLYENIEELSKILKKDLS
ncbi:diadenylate cyclase [Aequorivita sp. F47161]|uniref:Diadenylate cyclase n=1 Tax=Aequorivita vitellina TaxID=2874475 RepID=A0A9X1QVC8_9FLAO|nr:diadenylate cyclase [Aequorivita vitellina]MCG2418117.1 diadenylate cyclase [Aequorivita vitellina]MCZ4318001.1 diadenylate cyclase [Aequorivita viscosa]